MENKNISMLTSIFQNVKTAIQSINDILPSINCDELKKEITSQESSYQIYSKECNMIAASENHNLKDNNWFEKAKLWSSIKISTLTNISTPHIAELLILGTTMGVIEMIQAIDQCENCDEEIVNLGKKLLNEEEKNVEKLKKFLKESKCK